MGTIWISDDANGRRRGGTDEDAARAVAAAEAVVAAAGATPAAAEAAYIRQWEEYDDEAPMTGLARVWIAAREAAQAAYTEGWRARPVVLLSIAA